MKSKPKSPIWPYLAILGCLFALSITAPSAWDRMARKETPDELVAARRVRPSPARNARKFYRYQQIENEEVERPTIINVEPVVPESAPADEPAPAVESDMLAQATAIEPLAAAYAEEYPPAVEVASRPVSPPPVEEVQPETPPAEQKTVSVDETAAVDETASAQEAAATAVDEPPAEPAYDAAVSSSNWPLPQTLINELTELRRVDAASHWADEARELINQLCAPDNEGGRSAKEILGDLRAITKRPTNVTANDQALETRATRVRYALQRWLDVWDPATEWDRLPAAQAIAPTTPARMQACLADAAALVRRGSQGAAWSKYLELDALGRLAAADPGQNEVQRRAAARKVLDRLSPNRLTQAQRTLAASPPIVALQEQLRAWAAEPVSSARLFAHLESFEETGLPSDARLVAADLRGLSFAAPAEAREISERVEAHYRNANVRLAIAAPLLNRMAPEPKRIDAPVNDVVMNVPVYGRSTVFTKLFLRLVPDTQRIRLGLEARGSISSDTVATSGPASFRSEGQSSFLVRKLVLIGPEGMTAYRSVAQADNNFSYLVGMETNFDGVPLVGSLVRNIARSQHEDAQDEARAEVEQKVATRARDQFDAEIRPHLAKATEKIQSKQVAALKRLGLEFTPVSLSTTQERIVARLRVAATEQLGAHTPRPQAPSDSWLSLQVHQSALNNVLEQLDLNGRTFTLVDLFTWVGEKLDRSGWANRDDLPENVRLTFADKDAVRVRCHEGHIEVTFSLAELTQGRNHWRNFSVRAYYAPHQDGLQPSFARDSTIFLEGKSLKGKPQVVLRTIFSKVLSRNRDLNFLDQKITSDPRLKDLKISQFLVEDGWIGLAYSPPRASGNIARRPK